MEAGKEEHLTGLLNLDKKTVAVHKSTVITDSNKAVGLSNKERTSSLECHGLVDSVSDPTLKERNDHAESHPVDTRILSMS